MKIRKRLGRPSPKRRPFLVELDPKIKALMEAIKDRDGVPYRAQIERAIVAWAQAQGIEANV